MIARNDCNSTGAYNLGLSLLSTKASLDPLDAAADGDISMLIAYDYESGPAKRREEGVWGL